MLRPDLATIFGAPSAHRVWHDIGFCNATGATGAIAGVAGASVSASAATIEVVSKFDGWNIRSRAFAVVRGFVSF